MMDHELITEIENRIANKHVLNHPFGHYSVLTL